MARNHDVTAYHGFGQCPACKGWGEKPRRAGLRRVMAKCRRCKGTGLLSER